MSAVVNISDVKIIIIIIIIIIIQHWVFGWKIWHKSRAEM